MYLSSPEGAQPCLPYSMQATSTERIELNEISAANEAMCTGDFQKQDHLDASKKRH